MRSNIECYSEGKVQEKNEPGELSEKGLGLLFRKRLSAEPRPLAER